MDPVRCPYGVIRDPYDPAQDPLGSQLTPEFAKIPHGRHVWSYGACTGPLWYPHGLFTGCLRFLNPYGTRKLLIHALKLYGSHTGGKIRTASHGPRTAMWVDVRFLFKTARTGPEILMWLDHYSAVTSTMTTERHCHDRHDEPVRRIINQRVAYPSDLSFK